MPAGHVPIYLYVSHPMKYITLLLFLVGCIFCEENRLDMVVIKGAVTINTIPVKNPCTIQELYANVLKAGDEPRRVNQTYGFNMDEKSRLMFGLSKDNKVTNVGLLMSDIASKRVTLKFEGNDITGKETLEDLKKKYKTDSVDTPINTLVFIGDIGNATVVVDRKTGVPTSIDFDLLVP